MTPSKISPNKTYLTFQQALVDVMKEMNRSIENAIRKDIKSTLQIFALQNVGILLAVVFLSFLALYEQAMDFEEYQMQYKKTS